MCKYNSYRPIYYLGIYLRYTKYSYIRLAASIQALHAGMLHVCMLHDCKQADPPKHCLHLRFGKIRSTKAITDKQSMKCKGELSMNFSSGLTKLIINNGSLSFLNISFICDLK